MGVQQEVPHEASDKLNSLYLLASTPSLVSTQDERGSVSQRDTAFGSPCHAGCSYAWSVSPQGPCAAQPLQP